MDGEHTKSFNFALFHNIFPQTQQSFPSVLPKKVHLIFLPNYSKPAHRKHVKHKKTSHHKLSKKNPLLSVEKNTWKQRKEVLASEKVLRFIKVNKSPVFHQLTYATVCSHPCFCVQNQKFENSGGHIAATSKLNGLNKFPCAKRTGLKGIKQEIVGQCKLFSRQNFVFVSCRVLKLTEFDFEWCTN